MDLIDTPPMVRWRDPADGFIWTVDGRPASLSDAMDADDRPDGILRDHLAAVQLHLRTISGWELPQDVNESAAKGLGRVLVAVARHVGELADAYSHMCDPDPSHLATVADAADILCRYLLAVGGVPPRDAARTEPVAAWDVTYAAWNPDDRRTGGWVNGDGHPVALSALTPADTAIAAHRDELVRAANQGDRATVALGLVEWVECHLEGDTVVLHDMASVVATAQAVGTWSTRRPKRR